MPPQKYLRLLQTNGQFIQVGAPEDAIPGFNIGSPREIEEMLKVAAEKNIQPWIQKRPMRDANQAVVDMADGKSRYNKLLTP
ncbi:hypothetical protein V2W45_1350467 [Cenococcum geophilum]